MSLFAELKRRNVLRAAVFYLAAAWLLAQVVTQILPVFDAPSWLLRWVIVAAFRRFRHAKVAHSARLADFSGFAVSIV